MAVEDDLQILDAKIKQLRLDYEQYFLGARPREPVVLRGEVQKLITYYSNVPIQNTGLRFKFSSLCARYLTLRRQWDVCLRKIEDGTYERHVFKADLHARKSAQPIEQPTPRTTAAPRGNRASDPLAASGVGDDVYGAYVDACRSVGQELGGVTRERLERVMTQQRETLRKQLGCSDVQFRVVVERGKAKLKASPVQHPRGS